MKARIFLASAALCAVLVPADALQAHGFVGDRFFPPTMATDDPFATDELLLPAFSIFKDPAGDGSPETLEFDSSFEFDKEIFPHFALGVSDTLIYLRPNGQPAVTGADDLELSAKYQFWQNDEHEAVLAVGMEADLGGTGDSRVGSDSFSTFTPTVYFGKGFGDLPDSLNLLKPLAVTGTIGESFPSRSGQSNNLETGLAVEYSLPYLQQTVKDYGIIAPFKNMIPLVEFSFETPENHGGHWQTTGTINPGVLYEAQTFQLGIEAIIPVNGQSGRHIGAMIQVQIFIDDLFPDIFGHPLFGE